MHYMQTRAASKVGHHYDCVTAKVYLFVEGAYFLPLWLDRILYGIKAMNFPFLCYVQQSTSRIDEVAPFNMYIFECDP